MPWPNISLGWNRGKPTETEINTLQTSSASKVKETSDELMQVEKNLAQLKVMPRTPANRQRVQSLLGRKARLQQSMALYSNGTDIMAQSQTTLESANYISDMTRVLKQQQQNMKRAKESMGDTTDVLEDLNEVQGEMSTVQSDMTSILGGYVDSSNLNAESNADTFSASVDDFYESEAPVAQPTYPGLAVPVPSSAPIAIPQLPAAGSGVPLAYQGGDAGASGVGSDALDDPSARVLKLLAAKQQK